MNEIFAGSTLWVGLLVSLIMTAALFVVSYRMNNGRRWRIFAIVFFLLFFVLPIIDAVWGIF